MSQNEDLISTVENVQLPKRSNLYLTVLWSFFVLSIFFVFAMSFVEEVIHPFLASMLIFVVFILFILTALSSISSKITIIIVTVVFAVSLLYLHSDKHVYVVGNTTTDRYSYVIKNPFTVLYAKKVYRQYEKNSYIVSAKMATDKVVEFEFSWSFTVLDEESSYEDIARQTKSGKSVTSYVNKIITDVISKVLEESVVNMDTNHIMNEAEALSDLFTQKVLSSGLPFQGEIILKSVKFVY